MSQIEYPPCYRDENVKSIMACCRCPLCINDCYDSPTEIAPRTFKSFKKKRDEK